MGLEHYDWGVLPSTQNETSEVRTPLTLSNEIKDIINGKVFCDLGCGEGDLALCCKRFAKKVIGVEFDPNRAEISRMKGLDVIQGDALAITPPDADIYYIWIGRKGIFVLERIPKGKVVIWVPQQDQRELADKMPNSEKFSMRYFRQGIPMTLVYYVVRK